MLNKRVLEEINNLILQYPHRDAALLPALFVVQKQLGYLSSEALENVADVLNLPPIHVKSVASFYSQYKLQPSGKYVIQICTNVSCMISESEGLIRYFNEKYNLKPGETTSDGRFSLLIMDCVGSCAEGPAMVINDCFYNNVTEKGLNKILAEYV